MKPRSYTTYEDLEIRIDDKPDKNGVNVKETLRRLDFRKDEKVNLVPTEDTSVRKILLLLNEPESISGEDEFTRRERLIDLLIANESHMHTFEASLQRNDIEQEVEQYESHTEQDEDFYTPASKDLVEARKVLVRYSLDHARKRLMKEKEVADSFIMAEEINRRRTLATQLKKTELVGSQVASSRPISSVKLSPCDSYLALGSWDGTIKTVSTASLEVVSTIEGHNGKVGKLDWSTVGDFVATGGEDNLVKIFSMNRGTLQQKAVFQGHERRVAGTKVHPSDRYLASASFDMTWRLWDIETQRELLLQEGHGKELFCLAFQCDGSLLCSAGLDCIGIVWDIRSGNTAMKLSGHTKPIYSVDWSPDGFHIATAGGDGSIKIWDVRKATEATTILAHSSIISTVQFDGVNGNVLLSSGYDKNINIYSSDNWLKIATLEGHTDKVLSVDMARDMHTIVSSGWDRSVKLWKVDQ